MKCTTSMLNRRQNNLLFFCAAFFSHFANLTTNKKRIRTYGRRLSANFIGTMFFTSFFLLQFKNKKIFYLRTTHNVTE